MVGQFAGNHNTVVGSSETKRETLRRKEFDFRDWFIGFTEGDGFFIIDKTGYLEFKLTQSSKDVDLLLDIKQKLGFGSVSLQDKKNKTYQYRVRAKEHLYDLILIFNGNLLTKTKKKQFERWVKAYNFKYDTAINIIKKRKNFSLDNAWLAGFSDAESKFTVNFIKCSKTSFQKIYVRYILSQTLNNEKALLSQIAVMLEGEVKSVAKGHKLFVNLSKLPKIILYFKKYPLKTQKSIFYFRWLKVYLLAVNQKNHIFNTAVKDEAVVVRKIKRLMKK